ncbi:hypothetical protein CLM76_00445 [Vreelandella venusta]|nr:hypothetical protein CLM76_00445 [Halomonas hydrothermalis]
MDELEFNPKELTREKKLWDVYLASRRIPFSRFNFISTLVVFILLVFNAAFSRETMPDTIELVREMASSGFAISLSTLGFLLAGFTIFATVSQPSLSLSMAAVTNEKSGLSYLKHNYFIFLRVFIYYIAFSVFSLSIIIFGHSGGLIATIINLSPNPDPLRFFIIKAAYVLLFTGYYFLIMQLKSFIFNIYSSVMTSLRWNAEGHDK